MCWGESMGGPHDCNLAMAGVGQGVFRILVFDGGDFDGGGGAEEISQRWPMTLACSECGRYMDIEIDGTEIDVGEVICGKCRAMEKRVEWEDDEG